MRTALLVFVMFFGTLFAQEDKSCRAWTVLKFDQKCVLITDDYEMWEINYLKQNIRTWGEWFNGKIPDQIDNQYIFTNYCWKENAPLQITYHSSSSLLDAQQYGGDQVNLADCSYVITNLETQEKALARPVLQISDFIKMRSEYITKLQSAVKLLSPGVEELLDDGIKMERFFVAILQAHESFKKGLPYDQRYLKLNENYDFMSILRKH